jgi:hypothetical protein
MQHSAKNQKGVICDTPTQYAARHRLHFEDLPKITVRGKANPVSIWQPYTKVVSSSAPQTPDPSVIATTTSQIESKATPLPRFRGLTAAAAAAASGTMTPARRPSNPDIVVRSSLSLRRVLLFSSFTFCVCLYNSNCHQS